MKGGKATAHLHTFLSFFLPHLTMDIEEKIYYFKKRPTEEIVSERLLRERLEEGKTLKHYIGFEISGYLHLGALITALKIKDLMKAGVKPSIFLADYHTWINKKLGGDLELIRKVAKGYFRKAFELIIGDGVDYILASELYDNDYWKLVLEIGNSATLSRVKRALTIMGREESESNPASFIIYPLMQAADIFKLDVDIAQAGMDQRKVHMLAIDVADKLGLKKPIALHTHLLPSLAGGTRMDAKMSKSKPESAIFLHDSEESISRKLSKAYCPPKIVEGNPVFEILKYILYRDDRDEVTIERPSKFGGDITATMEEVEKLYKEGKIHPLDLKKHVAKKLSEMLKPTREYFSKHEEELSFNITR